MREEQENSGKNIWLPQSMESLGRDEQFLFWLH
jgi:hypothetical protein